MTAPNWHRNAALVVPLLLVNAAAVYGQAGWAFDHLARNLAVSVLFAVAVESIGVFLAAEAHAALMAGHASGTLRLGSYAVGALVGCLNFAHFASPGYRPNPLAVTFGLLSSISPWLWAIRSRSMNRERLYELGLIDPRAVKFSRLRWALFPVRTFTAFRWAVWAGIQRPDDAVTAADARRVGRRRATVSTSDMVAAPTSVTEGLALPGTANRPAIMASPAPVPPAVVAEVGRELRTPTSPRKATPRKATKKPARKVPTSRRRSPDETRELAAQLRTQHPEITKTELARLIGITTERLRQVENSPVNGTPVTATTGG